MEMFVSLFGLPCLGFNRNIPSPEKKQLAGIQKINFPFSLL
jgi:hypothetical protein